MAVTYDPACATDKDRIRALIGDTDTSLDVTEALDDQEITFALSLESGLWQSAARAARMLAAKLARFCDLKVGQYDEKLSQKRDGLLATAKDLDSRALRLAVPSAGGVSVAAFELQQSDADRRPPAFEEGMTDNPRSLTELDDRLGDQP